MKPIKTLPIRQKTEEIIAKGYDESDFADNYWTELNVSGNRRIDRDAYSLRQYVKSLIDKEMLLPKPLICDVGCGPGNMVMDFRRNGYTCEGCEYSRSAIRLGKKHFDLNIPWADLRDSLPFGSDVFDFAYCIGVMTMIPLTSLQTSIAELTRIIKPKIGLLHILLINPGSTGPNAGNEPHLTSLPHSDWNSLFEAAGLVDVTDLARPQDFGIGVNADWDFAKLYRRR